MGSVKTALSKKVEIENERTTINYRKNIYIYIYIYIYESWNFKGIKLKERYSLTN